ncbi:MAG: aminofutalosine synthase MqnE [Planctomycetes bacterium]|nr:aminofutalosine synthase MqnE [Planctomycetota bacterium]MBI3846274.1 aminofutalosine synthase MqnE [Planctomycetota bacterium]
MAESFAVHGDLTRIRRKIERNERLDREDGLALYASPDLAAIGQLANEASERKNGRRVTYIVNRHINYSNICGITCVFCAFGKRPGEADGYEFSMEEILARAGEAASAGATELHIVGGLHPTLPYDFYPEMLRAIKSRHPSLHLKAFTAVEIDYFATLSGKTLERVLLDLMDAGLDSLPGGGAEVFSERVRQKLFREKMGAERWLEVHDVAHRLGLRSNATLLYGHIERDDEKVDHLLRLREQQDRSRGFLTYIPLRFHPDNTPLEKLPEARGIRTLREIAVGRLLLDNFDHVKIYWIMAGLEVAQIALGYGADDFDGTVVEEKIYHMAGARTPEKLSEAELRSIITEAGKSPAKRDTLYRRVESSQGAITPAS